MTGLPSDPALMTAAEAGRALAARALSPVDLVGAFLSRIERLDGLVSSYVSVLADEALSAARDAEQEIAAGRCLGRLHGIPFAVKDNFMIAGAPARANSRIGPGEMPLATARSAQRLIDAGAILLGKVNTYEYGTGDGTGLFDLPERPARNPWDLDRFPGGSTTGGGAAVAAGLAPIVLGADTGGSVRLPAAACGVSGLKPTYDLVSRAGVLPNCYSLDCIGPIASTAEDIGLVMPILAEAQLGDWQDAEPLAAFDWTKLRVAVVRRFHASDVEADPEIVSGFEEAVRLLRGLGAKLVEREPAHGSSDFRYCSRIINAAECYAIHEAEFLSRGADMGQALRWKLSVGAQITAADYLRAQRWRRILAEEIDGLMVDCDVVLCCGATMTAPLLSEPEEIAGFTTRSAMSPFSLSGHPAISICNGFSRSGLPLNVQLAGRRFADARLVRVAAKLEHCFGLQSRRPRLDDASPGWSPPVGSGGSRDALDRSGVDEAKRSLQVTVQQLPPRFPKALEPFVGVKLERTPDASE